MVLTGSSAGSDSGLSPSRYSGVFLPGLERFTFSLPSGLRACAAVLDCGALYVWDGSESHVWSVALPDALPKVRRR
jgi:hypothetical protein